MGALFWLSDDQWAAVEPHLPSNQPGARRVDDRRIISGILHVLKIGCRWQDCPTAYGPSTTVYNRFNRWSRRRFWLKLLETLAASGAVTRSTAVDSTYIKAQRSAFGGKGAEQARAHGLRSRLGWRAEGPKRTPSAPRAAARRPKSMLSRTSSGAPSS